MTTEEKAKAYDEAIEKINRCSTDKYGCVIGIKPSDIFPQFSESEDERIRKELLELIKHCYEDGGYALCTDDYKKFSNYLEKQKEQTGKKWIYEDDYKSQLDAQYQQGLEDGRKEQKPLLTEETEQNSIAFLEQMEYTCIPPGKEQPAEWSEEDKLHLNNAILAAEKEWGNDSCTSRWLKLLPTRFSLQPKQGWNEEDEKMLYSIIEVLEVMPSARFIPIKREIMIPWLKALHERFNLQSKQEWSEEDKKKISELKTFIAQCNGFNKANRQKAFEMIDALRPQPYWKPSEQEKGALRTAIYILTEERNFPLAATHLQNILNVFEGKESRKDWKPSEEQMIALKKAICYLAEYGASDDDLVLDTLYDELKKYSL